ncbi:MAG: FAD binding domain-containing protein [Bacillota bacterium]|nr:FAD binding domain-containing protein [Bacillota bacterium]MDW7676495.1 FAD binding domain-containing protein [Bacillota bacterium]
MITVKRVVTPSSTAEAFEVLQSHRFATLLGGGAFLRMGSKNISTLIDLSNCGLNDVTQRNESWQIGAMVTLGELEHHEGLNQQFDGLFGSAVRDIVGVQLRNVVTVGASVYSRYGFSDLITGLLALPVRVRLHKAGILPLEDFLEKGPEGRDLLEALIIPSGRCAAYTTSLRKSAGDYALLNVGAAIVDGYVRISVGARPGRARLATKAMALLQASGWSETVIEKTAGIVATELSFGNNSRAGREYRQQVCRVLVKRVLKEVARREAEHNH